MGMLARLSTVVAPPKVHGESMFANYTRAFLNGDDVMMGAYAGEIWPELALTLSYVYCAVDTLSADFGTMTCQTFEDKGGDARARVSYNAPGIGQLARKLRWQPNSWQTSKAFWSTMAWQYQLRPAAYAEIIYRPGSDSFLEELIPRHPDRVEQQVLPSGRIRYKLNGEPNGPRYVTQDEMFVVRNTSTDGLNALGRVAYGSPSLFSAMALQNFTSAYFKKGATASLVATYKGEKADEDEADLHKSITRYMSGTENAGGLLVIPEDIEIKGLGVDPDKAQLLGLKNLSGRDVARLWKMPPSWLGIEGSSSYNSQVQDATNYVNRCQVPMVVEFEQAIQRDLILAIDRFYVKFNMDYLLRADLLTRMQAYEVGIRSRVLRPSEARVREDMSPDPTLDRLSEGDNRPGTSAPPAKDKEASLAGPFGGRATLKSMLALHGNATRCVRRERVAVEKIAKKHPGDVEAWHGALREFYADQASFVAQTMRLPMDLARAYAAQHGEAFEAQGLRLIDGDAGEVWEREEAEELTALALDCGRQAA